MYYIDLLISRSIKLWTLEKIMTFYSFLKKHCLKSWGIHLDLSLPVRSFLFNLIFQPFKTHPIIKWEGNKLVIDWPIKLIPLYFKLFSLHYSVLTRQAASVFRQPRCSSSPGQLVLQLSAVRRLHMLVPGVGGATGVFQYQYSVMHSCLDLYNSSFLVFELCYNKCVICCVDHQQFWYLHSRQCHDSVSPTQSCRHQQHSSDDSGNCYKQRYVTRHS